MQGSPFAYSQQGRQTWQCPPSPLCSPDFVWRDELGLHLNVRPTRACSSWASSEVYLDKSLGKRFPSLVREIYGGKAWRDGVHV